MLRDIDAGQARSRLELSQALIWVANLGKPNNAGTVGLFNVEKRLGISIPCSRGDHDVFCVECNTQPSKRLFKSVTPSSQING
jgi:hypothetical protein